MLRAIEHAEKIEKEAPPIARRIFRDVCSALFSLGTKDAAYRRFVLVLMWYAVGRTAEAALASWNLTRWDFTFNMLFFEWSQKKTLKQKGILMPG